MELNENQLKVLDTFINKNFCFVNASAGTGKTTTLIESYIALLEKEKTQNYNSEYIVKSIVVITFTKAAANEMLIRVRTRVREKIKVAVDSREKKYWQDIYNSILSNNNITTIHAFAQKLVSENALHLGCPSSINILEEDDDFRDNLHHIIDKLLETSDNGEKIYYFYKLYIINNREKFISEILNFINGIKPRLESIENFENVVYKLIEKDANYEAIISEINNDDIDICLSFENKTKSEKSILSIAGAKDLLTILKNILSQYKNKKNDSDYVIELFESILSITNFKLGVVANIFKNSFNEIKISCKKLAKSLEYVVYKKEITYFMNFIKEAYIKIENMKIKTGVYSHDDIISLAIEALQDKEIGLKIRNTIKALILDEAQDTSVLQFNFINLIIFGKREIEKSDIESISGKRLFIVGDKKQSIYRFRDANVDEFLRLENKFSEYKTVLKDNYRSNENLINFFNNFFGNYVFLKDQINYTDDDDLVDHKKTEDKKSIDFLALSHNTENGDKIKAKESYLLESIAIAKYIKQNIKQDEYKKTAILLQRFTNMYLYLNALSKYKIPFYVEGGSGFYKKEEIFEISGFLYYLYLFEEGSIDLLLTYGFFDISIDDIFTFKNALAKHSLTIDDYISIHKEKNVYKYKIASNVASSMSFYNKLCEIKNIINSIQKITYVKKASDVIETICSSTNYYSYIATKIEAEMILANIEKLKDMARNYEHTTGKTAYDFVVYIKKESECDEAVSQVPKLDIESLQIMTIHKSKGLEFDNTFFSSIGGKFNVSNYSNFYFYDNIPIIKLAVSKDRTVVFPRLDDVTYKSKNESERKRLLYVALTRASKKLILSGESSSPSYRDMFDNYFTNTNKKVVSNNINETSEKIENIVLDENSENDIANIYLYGRGIKQQKEKNILSVDSDIYNETAKNIIYEDENSIKNIKHIKVNIASKHSTQKIEYDLDSLMIKEVSEKYYDNDYDNEKENNYEEKYIKPTPADIGTIIHNLFEKFDFETYKKERDNYKKKLINEALIYFSSYNSNFIKTTVSKAIDNFLNDKHIKNIIDGSEYIVMREHSFQQTYTDENLNININRGKIDLITKDKNNIYYIIDYKNTVKTKEKEDYYSKQMSIYKDILSDNMKIDKASIETYLMFLK